MSAVRSLLNGNSLDVPPFPTPRNKSTRLDETPIVPTGGDEEDIKGDDYGDAKLSLEASEL